MEQYYLDNLPDFLYTKQWHHQFMDVKNNPIFDIHQVKDEGIKSFIDEWYERTTSIREKEKNLDDLANRAVFKHNLLSVWNELITEDNNHHLFRRHMANKFNISIENNIDLLITLKAFKDIYLNLEGRFGYYQIPYRTDNV